MTDSKSDTSFDRFAEEYDTAMGESGDYTHKHTIDVALFGAMGDIKGKRIYDVSCGNGYLARRVVLEGANEVLASDISKKLISLASTKYGNPNNKIKYISCDSSDFSGVPENHFDIVFMNMAIHYVKDIDKFAAGVRNTLKDNGCFVFTVRHALQKLAIKDARKVSTPKAFSEILGLGREYLELGAKTVYNLWTKSDDLITYSAPLSHYINGFARHGLLVDHMVEQRTEMDWEGEPKSSPVPFVYAVRVRKV